MATSLDKALENLSIQDVPNVNQTAKTFGVVESTLRRRWKGISTSRQEASSLYKQRLTKAQEDALISQINRLTDRGMPPTTNMVKNFAEEIIKSPVGKNWTGDFVRRHKDQLKSLYLTNIDNKRIKSEYAPSFKMFYSLLNDAVEKYHITAENTYNWDEKGFLMGIGSCVQKIMSLEAFKSYRIRAASQDGNREFITILACICAAGGFLPPALIYSGEAQCLQDTWVEDFKPEDEAYFATSSSGWTCDELDLSWLKKVFDPCTKKKAGSRRRLLIVDGHSSHVNMKFINECDKLRILLLILPPHSTHRLQPLDVSLFSPLATYYTQEMNDHFFNSLGEVGLSKRSFWKMFSAAWKKAFTVKNIESAFRKTGIFPFNPSLILDVITKPALIEFPKYIKTPMTNHAVRRIHRTYKNAPSSPLLAKILRANERLAAEHSIDQHIIKGLNLALREEKKRRQRGKRLNLVGEEDSGPQFFSPGRVQAARDRQTAKEEEKIQRQQQMEEKKASAAAARQQKEKEKAERMTIAAEKKKFSEEIKAKKLAEKQVQIELKNDAIRNNKASQSSKTANPRPDNNPAQQNEKEKSSDVAVDVERVEAPILRTIRGRQVQRPKHLDD